MKSILFSVLFLFIPKLCISQLPPNDKAIYLDSLKNFSTEQNHIYIRVIKDFQLNKDLYEISDFYKSGKIEMKGTSKSKDGFSKDGQFIYYYENGNKKQMIKFVDSLPNGKRFEWYENGNIKLEEEYIEDKKKHNSAELKINQYWNSKNIQTVIDGNGDYDEINENFFASGKIKNGFKDGLWEGYDKQAGYTFSENYENQKIISGVSIDSNKVEHKYNVLETRPEPKKGMNDFYRHIAKTFKTPEVQGLKGKVFVKFVVDTDGSIKDLKVLKDVGYGTGEEAVKAIASYGDWIPGEQRGRKVRATFSLPIEIHSNY